MTELPDLVVTTTDPTPPYEQLRRQLAGLIGDGVLPPGARLPPLRQLAGDLGLAVGTVARTYRELESAGLLVSRRGGGTRVADQVPTPRSGPVALDEAAQEYVQRALALGMDRTAIMTAARRALDAHPAPTPR
jgi:GntR family transcriptional regulator